MALIGKIREKSALLVIIIGVALLAFILTDWQSMFGGSAGQEMGYVAGEKVDMNRYNELVQAAMQQDQQAAQQSGREFGVREQEQARQKAWSTLVQEMVLKSEHEALGIEVSEKELDAYLYGEAGFSVLDDLAKSFADPATGKFSPSLLQKRIQEMEDSKDAQVVEQWKSTKKSMMDGRKNEKYFQLVSMGAYVTKLEAAEEYKAQKEQKNISYVMKRYSDIKDDQIKITDKEVMDYYEEHKTDVKYEVLTAGREVRYFDINIQPSKEDSLKFNTEITILKKQFQATNKDSLFMVKHTENQQAKLNRSTFPFRVEGDPEAKGEMIYPAFMDTVFKTSAVGTVVGPYNANGRTYLAKVKGFNTQFLTARHILIGANKADTLLAAKAKKQADSIVAILNADNFEEMVKKFSQDQGSIEKGGKYTDFLEDEFVPEFSQFCLVNPVGKIGVVQSQFGYHIIEVLGKRATKAPVLTVVEKMLKPSSTTESDISDRAYTTLINFDTKIQKKATNLEKIALFDTLAKKEGFVVRPTSLISDESPSVYGFATSFAEDKIIKLAFDKGNEVGTLCSAPIKDQNRYIIAMLSSIKRKGVPAFEDVEATMRMDLIKEKKAKRLINQLLGSKTLEAAAKAGNTTVQQGMITFGNPQIAGGGYEPTIVGSLFFAGLKDGTKTLPLKGEQGVYVIRIDKTIKAPAIPNYDVEKQQLLAGVKGRMQNEILTALIKKADVKDNRRFNAINVMREE